MLRKDVVTDACKNCQGIIKITDLLKHLQVLKITRLCLHEPLLEPAQFRPCLHPPLEKRSVNRGKQCQGDRKQEQISQHLCLLAVKKEAGDKPYYRYHNRRAPNIQDYEYVKPGRDGPQHPPRHFPVPVLNYHRQQRKCKRRSVEPSAPQQPDELRLTLILGTDCVLQRPPDIKYVSGRRRNKTCNDNPGERLKQLPVPLVTGYVFVTGNENRHRKDYLRHCFE